MVTAVLPPFPDDVPVHTLTIIDYSLLEAGDTGEREKLWTAATQYGFWYLVNHDMTPLFEPMFEMARETMKLPIKEKMKYWQGNQGGSFGYKAAGSMYADRDGSTDNAEFINVSKDDALAFPEVVHHIYPSTVNACMESAVRPFIKASIKVNDLLLDIFNEKLGLPTGALKGRHRFTDRSICEARCIKVPASPGSTKIAVGAHTDFGSISYLVNQLGGLQVLLPGETDWKYVKPVKGLAICNIGDALDILSGGILQSCVHRVLPPPGIQSNYDRWSLVYFYRPNDTVVLKPLVDESSVIAEAINKSGSNPKYTVNMTAAQWFTKRQTQVRADIGKKAEDYFK